MSYSISNYIGVKCDTCGHNVRRRKSDECVHCYPQYGIKRTTKEAVREAVRRRRAIEAHQNKDKENDYQL